MYLSNLLDPIFYLHLTNVDRIWWKWQKRHETIDKLSPQSLEITVSLDDPLEFISYPGMPDHPLRVKDVLKTESDLLCYNYPM